MLNVSHCNKSLDSNELPFNPATICLSRGSHVVVTPLPTEIIEGEYIYGEEVMNLIALD